MAKFIQEQKRRSSPRRSYDRYDELDDTEFYRAPLVVDFGEEELLAKTDALLEEIGREALAEA